MKPGRDYETRFKSTGVGITSKQQPISIMYPLDIDGILRSLPNRSEYIRNAVIKQLREDGLLPVDKGAA